MFHMHTKIVATIGPSCNSPEMLRALVDAGMDIARVNFSHAHHEGYREIKKNLTAISETVGKEIKLLADLQGPRMRVGVLPEEGVRLFGDHEAIFSTNKDDTDAIFIDNPFLHHEILPGEPLYLANGDIECRVEKVVGNKIFTTVIHGGILFSRKGVNTPRTKLSIAGVTEKDLNDVKAVLEVGVDIIAVSFVQRASDLNPIRSLSGDVKVMSKIESAFVLDYIDEVIQASDGIMIARGDLGIEVPREKVPFIQKHLIKHAAWHGKPSITATQMLMSMVSHPHPTRAEVSDVANAIFDGSHGVMLSDETASGKYPVESVSIMRTIAEETERMIPVPFCDL
jgi:pyruvate kinase